MCGSAGGFFFLTYNTVIKAGECVRPCLLPWADPQSGQLNKHGDAMPTSSLVHLFLIETWCDTCDEGMSGVS